MPVKNDRDLIAWQKARDLVNGVYTMAAETGRLLAGRHRTLSKRQ